MFTLFTALNLPLYVVYGIGQTNDEVDGKSFDERKSIFSLNLGNLGASTDQCLIIPIGQVHNIDTYTPHNVICKYGRIAEIT